MTPTLPLKTGRRIVVIIAMLLFSTMGFAQTETFSTGSFIINMGATNPNTVANGLKPYGMIYDLIRNFNVPIKCIINPTKVKDGVDFTYNGVQYKGGTFVIQSEFRSAAVDARIAYWTGQGVVGTTTTSAMTLNVTKTIVSVPRWTLDAQNGKIAENFLLNAGINNIAFPGAYNWKAPSLLDCCDDYFVMPHADPTWAVHGHLWSWNKDCFGAIWGGCHAVSVLENMSNPSNPAQKTNFLSTTGLLLFSAHHNGSPPYIHQYPADPVAQYLGATDLAMQNGSEQCFMPSPGSAWNPSAKIIAFDPSQEDVPSKSPGPAVVIVYGRGMDDPNRGYVLYEAGHNLNNSSAGSVAAQRVFFNFSFFNTLYKVPQLAATGIIDGQHIASSSTTALHITATSIVPGMTYTYQWSSTCGGSFSNPTGASTNYTAPAVAANSTCVITCQVIDNCGRSSFSAFIIVLGPGNPPIANNDAANIDPGCGLSASITTNVLANDSDPDGRPLTLTQVNGHAGSFTTINGGSVSFNAAGNITYTNAVGFTGAETLNYTVCDNAPTPLCSIGTYTISVGNPVNVPNTGNDSISIAEDNIASINVLANDVPVILGPLTVEGIPIPPANGKVSINTDNTITYIPNPDFAGTDNFTYRIVNAAGYTKTATVTVTVINDACDGGTYLVAPPLTVTNTVYLSPTNDTYLDQSNPNKAYGGGTSLLIDGQSSQVNRSLLKFDLSSLPAGATITNASLQLVATAIASGSAENIEAHAMTTDWIEGTNTGNTGVPSWNQYSTGNTWVTAGGDFNAAVESTTSVASTGIYNWNITNMVNNWYSSPANNFGMLLKFTTESGGNQVKTFASKENTTISNRPVLSVTYTTTGTSGSIVLDATEDSYSYEGAKGTVFNPDDNWVGNVISGNTARNFTMLKFPVNGSTLPAGANLTGASLSMAVKATVLPAAGITVSAYGITENWTETQMDWNNRISGTPWTTPGGTFNASVQGSASVLPASISSTWGVTSLVQGWINTPASNLGVLLKDPTNQTASAYYVRYYDKDVNTNAMFRPRLTLNWTSVSCLPIPTRAPLGMPDTATTISSTPVLFNVVNNDNLFGQAVSSLTISTAPIPAQGAAIANLGGTVTFTPNPTFNGVASFEYTVTTATGSDVVKAYVRVNNSPVNANDDYPAGHHSGLVQTIDILANDVDPEGATLTVALLSQPVNGTATLNGSNQLVYTPNANFTGTDTLHYSVCEPPSATCGNAYCDTALVTITVLNRKPIANPDVKNGLPCQAGKIVLIANDSDPEGNALTVTNISALSNPAAGTITDNLDGSVNFTPAMGFTGTVTFTYTVTDNGNPPQTSLPATVTINITPAPNNPPVALNDIAGASYMDEPVYYDVRNNDYDPDENALTNPVIIVNPLHGTATVLANGLVQYNPNPGFFGTDILTYQICDIVMNPATCSAAPGLCATATLTINIAVPNTVVAVNDQNSTWVNTPVDGAVLTNDFDLEGEVIQFTGFIDNHGLANVSGSIQVAGTNATGGNVTNAGTLDIKPDGSYTFTPQPGLAGVATVLYTIRDNNPNAALDTAILKITINPYKADGNSVISNNDETVTYGGIVNGNVLINDRDPYGGSFTVTGYQYDADGEQLINSSGTLGSPIAIGGTTLVGTPVSNAGSFILNANGSFSFTPAPDFHGEVDINYSICDNGSPAVCSSSSLHIDVLADFNGAQNDRPFNGDDFMNTMINTPVTANFIQNDLDPNSDTISVNGTNINSGGPHTVAQTLGTQKGGSIILFADGTCTYTPPLNYIGPDEVIYQVCDVTAVNPQPLCSTGTLYMLVDQGSLLPVDLLSFSGHRQGKDNLLEWSTAQENKSDHFELEHRTDNSSFSKIGSVKAKGTSTVRSDYNFIHRDPPAGVNYYRLKLVDIDSKFIYSNTIAINNDGVGITLNSAYPNPFNDAVNIAITLDRAEKFTVNLYDISGKLVRTNTVMANAGFNVINLNGLKNLAAGIYFVEVITNEKVERWKMFKKSL